MNPVNIGEFKVTNNDDEDTRIAKEYLQFFCRVFPEADSEEKITAARKKLNGRQGLIAIDCLLREKITLPTE